MKRYFWDREACRNALAALAGFSLLWIAATPFMESAEDSSHRYASLTSAARTDPAEARRIAAEQAESHLFNCLRLQSSWACLAISVLGMGLLATPRMPTGPST